MAIQVPPPFLHGVALPEYPTSYPVTSGPELGDRISMLRLLYSIDANIKRQDAVIRDAIRQEVTVNLVRFEVQTLLAVARLEAVEACMSRVKEILERATAECYGCEGAIRVFNTNL